MEFRHTELLEKVDELTMSGFNSLCLAEQKEEVKKTGNFETIRKDWDIMRTGGIKINQEKLDYNVLGGAVNNLREGNSNSVTNTLGKVAGIGTEIQLDGSLWVPGIEKNLLPVEKYPDFYIAIGGDVTSSVEVTVAEEAVAGASTLPQVEIAALVALAVSGGSDSVALLMLTHRWAKASNVNLVVISIDHHLRQESKLENEYVRALSHKLGYEHHQLHFDHQNNFANLQARAREAHFLTKIDEKAVSSTRIQGRIISGTFNDGTNFSTYAPDYPDLINKLSNNGAHIEVIPPDTKMNSLFSIFVSWFPMILLIGVWVFFMRQMQGGGKAMGFGKSKAKLISDKGPKITFKDVAGINEAKEELTEIVDFLRDPSKFQKLGGKIPKGCLLIGPPGTGKTLLAKAIAGEANVPFFSISGSDFVEMFVGVGASRVRDMFEQGKRNAPCIIFIDEIDAVGRHRGIGMGGGNDEREQTLNQMLVEMDGFEDNEGVIIIAATNRPDVLDSALLRPGRFDRHINIPLPDINGREEILQVHLKKIKCAKSILARTIARGTSRLSGAQLANLVNESALIAARKGKKEVNMAEIEEAKDKVIMGIERRSMVMTDEEKKLTAYHEGGHALVGLYCPGSDPIHKATIMPRGRALGMVQTLPENDEVSKTRQQLEAYITISMAGRAAEELIFGREKVTTGATSDIKGATSIAKHMVMEGGLSDVIGPVYHSSSNEDSYGSGRSASHTSEYTSELIDKEVKQIIGKGYERAKSILTENIDQLHFLAKMLIEHETLSGQQIKNLLSNRPLNSEAENLFPQKNVEG
ncbi:ATP-dependent zinc metalloprotease FtsH [Pseudolycoriella hygida]|uniref:ATP-dependent zinc metalloprotease FtsH n=1 Tax=Pseudolycoriella hygida TaxID=35572 RepID=A0A9Q0S5K3_9DIPT|nr:ATP-dependent zinc metalloprotease FtsH [Pseudolycoriella hygida]